MAGREGILLWDLNEESLISDRMQGHDDAVISLVFDSASQFLFSGSRDREIVQWSVATQAAIQRFVGHTDWVLSLAVSPDDSLLVSGERSGAIRLWELATGRPMGGAIGGPVGWVTALHFVDERRVIGSNRDNAVGIEWTFSEDDWVQLACDISNRTLTESEWMQFFTNSDYHPQCSAIDEG